MFQLLLTVQHFIIKMTRRGWGTRLYPMGAIRSENSSSKHRRNVCVENGAGEGKHEIGDQLHFQTQFCTILKLK